MFKKTVLVLFFLICFSSFVFASEKDDVESKLKDFVETFDYKGLAWDEYILYKLDDGRYCATVFTDIRIIDISDSSRYSLIATESDSYYGSLQYSDGEWSFGYSYGSGGGTDYFKPSVSKVVGSSFDIKTTSGDVFFSLPEPSPVEELPRVVIPQVVVIAGVGISMICLTLSPNLLKRVFKSF